MTTQSNPWEKRKYHNSKESENENLNMTGVGGREKKKLNLIAGDVAIKFLKLMIRVRCCRMEKQVLLAMKSSDSLI